MSQSMRVIGFVSPIDKEYRNHSNVLLACIEAGIKELPKETAIYFGSKYPEKYLLEEKLEIDIPHREYKEDMQDGYDVLVSEIPEGVHKIRFYVSY